ncbi:Carboxylic ester hydrolase [Aspergillus mulundensis]|uniref:Carboxylic ester hydrolase n=1 Tax=Aspergillus mulundensis TaxID=1810919 RepID=A0A3D8T4R9_9EURO|nr:Carboxylic ester hydrolase [Aspergillus mulundensis]RDW93545.1 Carboxylic ester hydrolase [Aspergillus mulundensis]
MDAFTTRCSGLRIPRPSIPNATVELQRVHLHTGVSAYIPESIYVNHGPVNVTDVSYCVVSISYTHTHRIEVVNTEVWLPTDDMWNGRMMGLGGGGFYCGLFFENKRAMLGAVGEGYAAVSTDCGRRLREDNADWLLDRPGKVNLHRLEDFASVTLNDAAVIRKSVVESFYGRKPDHSYFSGCSQGGRQGMMLAQRYPDAYDGIVASAPAINWAEILVAGYWTQFTMNQLDSYPRYCELDYITNMAIESCDDLDGVHDGIVSDVDACDIDALAMVGADVPCGEETVPLSTSAAIVANAAWRGPTTKDGVNLSAGVSVVSNLTNDFSSQCSPNGICSGLPVIYSSDWIRLAIEKDARFDLKTMTLDMYVKIFNESVEEYKSIIGTDNPDLSKFSQRGGKILSFHGLVDPMIPSTNTRRYYEAVTEMDPTVQSYYRVFEAPGLGHCWSQSGLYPSTIFDDLVAWVEKGQAPPSLLASFTDATGVKHDRVICPYPERAIYNGHGFPCSLDRLVLQQRPDL